jgi:hypothetical protein
VAAFLFAHDLFGRPLHTFPDHALMAKQVRIMLRFKILVSVVPLIVSAILARAEWFPSTRPCIALGAAAVQIASAPWHADLHVSFTDNPARATVRVAISDNAETADFAVVDDVDALQEEACEATPATQLVAISAHPSASAPVIYLTRDDGGADYRIFVRSKRFSDREAAALIVGAHGERPRLAASL